MARDAELSQIQELGDRRSQLSTQKLNKRQLIKRQVHDSPTFIIFTHEGILIS